MKHFLKILLFAVFLIPIKHAIAQNEDLEALLEDEIGVVQENTYGTFLSTFVLCNPSVEVLNKNGLNFRFSHKFGYFSSGAEHFYGFDNSYAFIGIEYAPLDWINIGLARSTFRASINGQLKVRILRQAQGLRNIPISLVAYGEMDYTTERHANADVNKDYAGRIEYTSQLLIARKFGTLFSLQLMPGYIHRNLVKTTEDLNNIWSVGFAGTLRLFKKLRLNAEYFWVQEHNTAEETFYAPFSLGVCYQTARHSFELFTTNSQGITLNNHIARTTGSFWKGDICIGFNVSIIFSVKR